MSFTIFLFLQYRESILHHTGDSPEKSRQAQEGSLNVPGTEALIKSIPGKNAESPAAESSATFAPGLVQSANVAEKRSSPTKSSPTHSLIDNGAPNMDESVEVESSAGQVAQFSVEEKEGESQATYSPQKMEWLRPLSSHMKHSTKIAAGFEKSPRSPQKVWLRKHLQHLNEISGSTAHVELEELHKQLDAAKITEEFEKCIELKQKIKMLTKVVVSLSVTRQAIKRAVRVENFDRALEMDRKLTALPKSLAEAEDVVPLARPNLLRGLISPAHLRQALTAETPDRVDSKSHPLGEARTLSWNTDNQSPVAATEVREDPLLTERRDDIEVHIEAPTLLEYQQSTPPSPPPPPPPPTERGRFRWLQFWKTREIEIEIDQKGATKTPLSAREKEVDEAAARLRVREEWNGRALELEKCALCQEVLNPAQATTLPCSHSFHSNCVNELETTFGIIGACSKCSNKELDEFGGSSEANAEKQFEVAARHFFVLDRRIFREKGRWEDISRLEQRRLKGYVETMRSAAEKGVVRAQFALGVMYESGRGVPRSDDESLRWYRKLCSDFAS